MKRLLILHCKMAFQVQRALRTFKHFTHQTPKQYRGDRPAITENQQSAQHNYHDRELILLLNDYIEEMNHFIEDIEKMNYKEIALNQLINN